jgi:hypothetical protein
MLMTLASSFMTATRMDGFSHEGAAASGARRRAARTLAARVFAGLKRLAG